MGKELPLFILLTLLCLMQCGHSAMLEFSKASIVGELEGKITHFIMKDEKSYAAGLVKGPNGKDLLKYGEISEGSFVWNQTVEDVDDIYHFGAHQDGFYLIASITAATELPGKESGHPTRVNPSSGTKSVFATSLDERGQASWVHTFGLEPIELMAFSASEGDSSDMLLVGNLLKFLDDDRKFESDLETLMIAFSNVDGTKGTEVLNFHRGQDACDSSPCKNGGTCTVEDEEPNCACLPGFVGTACEKAPCKDWNCQNDGTCSVGNDEEPKCDCASGFNGTHCEITPCTSNPCKNQGICTVENGGAKCTCPDGFIGHDCGEKATCDHWICENNGTCSMVDDKPMCNCTSGFSGTHCEGAPQRLKRRMESQEKDYLTMIQTGNKDGDFFTVSTGLHFSDPQYSAFVTLHKKKENLYHKIWTISIDVGLNAIFPSILTFTHDDKTEIIFAGTLSASTEFKGFPLEVPENKTAIFISRITLDDVHQQTVIWATAITGIGSFAEGKPFGLPLAERCEESESCQILVAGPSTNQTKSGDVAIDVYDTHASFLASLDLQSGKASWIKELFPNAKSGEVRALQVLSNGTVAVAGSISGGKIELDYLPDMRADNPSLFVGYLETHVTKPEEEKPPEPETPENGSYMYPMAIGISLLVGGVICFRWRKGKSRGFRSRRSAGQQYARVNDFEMDNMEEDVTVFAIDVDEGRR